MKLERTENNKATFKNCILQKDENGQLWLVEDLGDKGTESNNLEEVIMTVFGGEPFNITFQSKVEL